MRSPVETMRGGSSTSLAERSGNRRSGAKGQGSVGLSRKKKKLEKSDGELGPFFCSQVLQSHDCPDRLGMD